MSSTDLPKSYAKYVLPKAELFTYVRLHLGQLHPQLQDVRPSSGLLDPVHRDGVQPLLSSHRATSQQGAAAHVPAHYTTSDNTAVVSGIVDGV